MSRKKLSAEEEQDFITGGSKEASVQKQPTPDTELTQEEKLKQLLSAPKADKEATTRFTADLPDTLHERLGAAANKAKKSKVQLVREILDAVLP